MKRIIVTADDFGLSVGVNEAVEQAHRAGLLTTASLMVAGPAAADAIARAKRLPELRVGLHVVAVEGYPGCAAHSLPDLVDEDGMISGDQRRLAFSYAFSGEARRQLKREIEAQFMAFAATGLPLDHANAHKHMHLHPVVGKLLVDTGIRHGLRAVRVPMEPPGPLERGGYAPSRTVAAGTLRRWTRLLRWQAERAGMVTNDYCFGTAWSGHMTPARLIDLAAKLPDGLSEIFFHPAASRDPLLERLMPGYEHEMELRTLCDSAVAKAFDAAGAVRTTWDAVTRYA